MAFAWYSYDAFLSHAVEDKAVIADEICKRLREKKLRVWYSGDGLMAGTDISSQVHSAINKSRNGVFILSSAFIESEWTKREYYLMKARDGKGESAIFPVFLNLRPEDVARMDPNLVDIYGLDVSRGAEVIAAKIANVIKAKNARRYYRRSIAVACIAAITLSAVFLTKQAATDDRSFVDTTSKITRAVPQPPVQQLSAQPPSALIESAIADRLAKLEALIRKEHAIPANNGRSITTGDVQVFLDQFHTQKSHFRNEFDFNDGKGATRAKKNVQKIIGFDPTTIVPGSDYVVKAGYVRQANGNRPLEVACALEPKETVKWTIYKPAINSIPYLVTVVYTNRVRLANIFLTFPLSPDDTRYNRVHLFGLPAEEHYEFVQNNGAWIRGRVY